MITGLDLVLTFSGMNREPPGARCEPCERCGTPLILDNLAAIAAGTRDAGGFRGAADPLEDLIRRQHDRTVWIEHLTGQGPAGRWLLQLRPHTAERCARARAGDPEPLQLDDEDEDDGEDLDVVDLVPVDEAQDDG